MTLCDLRVGAGPAPDDVVEPRDHHVAEREAAGLEAVDAGADIGLVPGDLRPAREHVVDANLLDPPHAGFVHGRPEAQADLRRVLALGGMRAKPAAFARKRLARTTRRPRPRWSAAAAYGRYRSSCSLLEFAPILFYQSLSRQALRDVRCDTSQMFASGRTSEVRRRSSSTLFGSGCRTILLTRFAPAPTGDFHLGHVVNAMLCVGPCAHPRWPGPASHRGSRSPARRREIRAAMLDDLDWLGFAPTSIPRSRSAPARATAGSASVTPSIARRSPRSSPRGSCSAARAPVASRSTAASPALAPRRRATLSGHVSRSRHSARMAPRLAAPAACDALEVFDDARTAVRRRIRRRSAAICCCVIGSATGPTSAPPPSTMPCRASSSSCAATICCPSTGRQLLLARLLGPALAAGIRAPSAHHEVGDTEVEQVGRRQRHSRPEVGRLDRRPGHRPRRRACRVGASAGAAHGSPDLPTLFGRKTDSG